MYIHTLRLIPKMGTKVRNRNLRLNHGKTFPIPTKFYQSSSFYILYRMPIKKTPNESRTKNASRGTVLRAGFGAGWVARPPAMTRWFVFFAAQTQKRGFSPQNLKSDHFQPKSCLYNFPTPSITSYNINLYQNHKIDDHLIIKHPITHLTSKCIN